MGNCICKSSKANSHKQGLLDSRSNLRSSSQFDSQLLSSSSKDENSNETFSTDSDNEVSQQSNEGLRIENELLKAKCDEVNKQLQAERNENEQLKAKFDEMSKQFVEQLQEEREENKQLKGNFDKMSKQFVEQLQAERNENKQLKAKCDEMSKQLETERNEKEAQTKATFDLLKSLGVNVHYNNKLYCALWNCYRECIRQNQYFKALAYLENAIHFEKSTQSRSTNLAEALNEKSYCYWRLKQYQKSIDAATLALHYVSNHKCSLLNRAMSFFESKKYLDAQLDMENLLRLHPDWERAHAAWAAFQEAINELDSNEFLVNLH